MYSLPITHFVNNEPFIARHQNFVASLRARKEPTNCKEVVKDYG